MLKPSLLLFSVNVRHKIISILCHKNLHTANASPTSKTEYSLFHILKIKTNYQLEYAPFNFLFKSQKFLIIGFDQKVISFHVKSTQPS